MGKLSEKQKAFIRKNIGNRTPEQISRMLGVKKNDVLKYINSTSNSTRKNKGDKKIFPIAAERVYKFTTTDYLIFLGLFAVSLTLYVYTMTPGVAAGDCGELTCAVYFLGGAHSPGYPLYCIMGKLFMWLFYPIGRIVYRLTFFSAFGGALTVALSYLFFIKFLGRYHFEDREKNFFFAKIPAIAASLYFLFSNDLWAQAVIAEVYTLNSLFLPMMFLMALVYEDRIKRNPVLLQPDKNIMYHWNPVVKIMFLFYFIFGVAMGDHHIILGYFVPFTFFFLYPHLKDKTFLKVVIAVTISYILALIMVVYYQLPDSFDNMAKIVILILIGYSFIKIYEDKPKFIKVILISGIFLILGLLVYVYMPIRSRANTPLDWGNPETWDRFWMVVTRKQYRGFAQNVRSLKVMLTQATILMKWRLEQFTPWLYIFTFFGLYRLFKINKKWFYFTISFLFYYDFAFMQFNNFKFTPRDMFFAEVFFIPSYMINIFWIAIGIEYVFTLASKFYERKFEKEKSVKSLKYVTTAIFILLTYLPFNANFDENNVRHAWANDNYGRNILKTLEYKSILFTEGGDNQVFSLLYHNYVEYLRPDVNDPNAPDDSPKRGIFDQKGNVFLLYGDMMRMTPKQLFESQVTHDYQKIMTGRPIYYTWKDLRRINEINRRYNKDFEYRQTGILYRICHKNEVFIHPINYWLYYDFAWEEYPEEAVHWDYLSREIIANYNFQMGDVQLAKAYDAYNKSQNPLISVRKREKYKKEYEKYKKKAFYYYRRAKIFGYDMTAIHFNLGLLLEQQINIYRRENDIEGINKLLAEAITNYLTAAKIENKQDNAPRAYFAAGRAYERKAFFNTDKETDYMKKALEYYKIAAELNPRYRDAQLGIRRANAYIKYPTSKIKEMENNLSKNPKQENLYLKLTQAYIDRFQYNEAVDVLERGVRNIPNSFNLLANLGNLYTQLNRLNDAVRVWKKVLARRPNEVNALFYLAESYNKLKEYKKAFDTYQRFINVAQRINNTQIRRMVVRARQQIRSLLPYLNLTQ